MFSRMPMNDTTALHPTDDRWRYCCRPPLGRGFDPLDYFLSNYHTEGVHKPHELVRLKGILIASIKLSLGSAVDAPKLGGMIGIELAICRLNSSPLCHSRRYQCRLTFNLSSRLCFPLSWRVVPLLLGLLIFCIVILAAA